MNGDRSFACVTKCCGFILVALVAFTGAMLFVKGFPALRTFGIHFVSSTVWDPVAGEFGVLPFMYGTVVSSLLALLLAVPVSLGIALFLTEFSPFFLRKNFYTILNFISSYLFKFCMPFLSHFCRYESHNIPTIVP